MFQGYGSIVAGVGLGAFVSVDWWLFDIAFQVRTLTPGWLFTCVVGGAVLGPFSCLIGTAVVIWRERR